MAKPKPPFDVGSLVVTNNDLTYLGRSQSTLAGTSMYTSHENYQYPRGTIFLVTDVSRESGRGWRYKFMTPDRGVLDSDYAHYKSWKTYLASAE
jgi:hypothetical protein